MSKKLIDEMVDRFLCWKLPKDFHPDAGISFTPTHFQQGENADLHWPVGTNLLTAEQVRAMFEHVLAGAVAPPDRYTTEEEGDAFAHGYIEGYDEAKRAP